MALRNGMWEELSGILPDDVAKKPRGLPAFITTSIDAERLNKVATGDSRLFLVGNISLRNQSNDLIPFTASPWRQTRGKADLAGDVAVEEESGRLLRYDLTGGPVVLERTLRSQQPLPASGKMPLPDSLTVGIRSDASWHRIYLDLETADAVYHSETPAWLERSAWQDLTWQFTRPEDRSLQVVVLQRDPKAKPSVAPGEIKLRLRLEPSSRWQTAYAKYSLNYRRALQYIPFWRFVGNSAYLVVLNILGQILACSLVAYAFARLRFYGRDVLFAVLLATMMLPGQVTMIPVFLIFKSLGWYNTLKPLWVGSWFGSAFYIFLLRQFFLTIPQDLEDAAKIDGCGFFGTYWRILLPLVRPALATVAIFTFMGTWNEFMGPLIYIGSEKLTPLSLGLFMFRSEHGGEWGMMMAASTLMTLPVVAIFFFAQRYFIQGITLTGMGGK
ncbi:MAG TPA: carbohydrate ABC transporter permease [Armatimonadota bacterium]|nr:carbohydrate ABC transporter permease [Armatimonadota bacterium]